MNEFSISKNDLNNDSENLKLPLINFKLIPPQKNINETSKNENDDGHKLKLIKSQTFLTSKKTETEKFDVVKPKKIISNEAIAGLLKEKIEIKNILNNNYISYKNIFEIMRKKNEINKRKKLNRYINEDILKNSPIRLHTNKSKLKNIKVNNIFTERDEDEKNKNDEDSNIDRSLYDLKLYNYIKESKETKKIKSSNKKEIKKKELDYIKSDWRKNINCSLDYKYLMNKQDIRDMNSLIKYMGKNSKLYFDVFRTESNDTLEKIWNN